MPKAVLHIGPEKTGSTALQQYLKRHASVLRTGGWVYEPVLGMWNHAPLVPLFSGGTDDSHLAKATGFYSGDKKSFRNELAGELGRISRAAGHQTRVLLVNELLSSRLTERESAGEFINFLLGFFDSVTVTLAIRPQVALIESLLSEELRWGAAHQPHWDRFKSYHWLDFRELWKLWSGHNARVDVKVFSLLDGLESESQTDVVSAFFNAAEIPQPQQTDQNYGNVHSSIGARGAAVLWAYNTLAENLDWTAAGIDDPVAFRLRLFNVLRSAHDDYRLRLDGTETNQVRSFYWRSNLQLNSALSADSFNRYINLVKPAEQMPGPVGSHNSMRWFRDFIQQYQEGQNEK